MFRQCITSAIRTMARHPAYTLITVGGLAAGMACCLYIFLFIHDELSYDRWHDNAKRIFRVAGEYASSEGINRVAVVPGPLAPALRTDFPEISGTVRFWRDANSESVIAGGGGKQFSESRFLFSEPEVFTVFSFSLVRGNPEKAINDPFTVVLSEEAARKYFGSGNPLGKKLLVHFGGPQEFTVTGVLRNAPRNSHFRFDFLASLSTLDSLQGYLLVDWRRADFYTYILLSEGSSPEQVEGKLPGFVKRRINPDDADRVRFFLQPLTSIHLHSHLEGEFERNGDIADISVFAAIALFILIVAGINFMNLSIAYSFHRLLETAIRKILGAERKQIIIQFIGESVITAGFALIIALALVEICLPLFQRLAGKDVGIAYYLSIPSLFGILLAGIIFGALAGFYPALLISRHSPVSIIKGSPASGRRNGIRIREILLIIQFAISTALVIGTGIAAGQIGFLRNKPLGFSKERIIVIPIGREVSRRYETIKSDLRKNPSIRGVTASSGYPGDPSISQYEFRAEGAPEDHLISMYGLNADQDFLETYGIQVLQGSNFSENDSSDREEAFIINETAAEAIGWENPIGKYLSHGIPRGRVIGVVRDFHFRSLHERIKPLYLFFSRSRFQYLSVLAAPGKTREALEFLKKRWKEIAPGAPFEYFFLSDNFESQHRDDARTARVFGSFAILSLGIACFGLFGLAAFIAGQRTREIGIRKALGAATPQIILMLSGEFIRLLLLAQVIAWPAAYIAMRFWLGSFAYHTGMRITTFVLGGLLTSTIALAGVSFQMVKAGMANPADTLRYE